MQTKRLLLAAAAALMPFSASAQANLSGYWTQSDFNNPCSAIFGFQLNANGAADVDWVETKLNAVSRKPEFVKQRRDGRWHAKGNSIQLTVTQVVTDTKLLKMFDKSAPVEMKTELTAPIAADGKRLDATVKAQNINHEVFTFKCVYNRGKR